jgi:hypothetical protein
LERSISIMLSDAKIPDSAFDWKNGFLIVDPAYHDRIVEVLKGYIPWELKSLPRIRKEQMSRTGAKAKFAATVAGAAAYTKNLVKSLGFYPDAVRFDTARDLLVLEFTSAPIIAVNCASKLSHALSTRGLGAQRVSINQSMEQRGGEDVGVVEINLDDVASRGLNSRAGAKTAFSIDAVKVAAAQVAKAYGAGADSAVIRKYLDRIVSVLSGNAEGGQREALGIHAQIGGVAEKSHGRDFMWSQPMQNLEKAIRSAGQFSRAGAKSTHAAPRPKFNLGDKVAIMDGGRVLDTGVIDYAYGYDDFQETYKYKVSTESGARKTWNEGSLKKMSRAGAKAAFAHPSWSAGILGKETAPQLAAYSWIDAHLGINGHRTQMLLADIAAEVHARNPALSIQQAIMKAAQEMVQKGVATYDIRALVEDKGWMSRAGAKSNGLTLAQRIAVEHDAKRMANR